MSPRWQYGLCHSQLVAGILALSMASLSVSADDHSKMMAQSLTLFKTDVRALLIESCVECHGGDNVHAQFDLTTRDGLLAGGEKGTSVIVGNSKESRLLSYLEHREKPFMPQDKPQLMQENVAAIARWIDLGAAYDKPLVDKATKQHRTKQVTDADREYWAFAPLQSDFPQGSSVDSFVQGKQKDRNLTVAPKASPSILIRRLYFDLIGLPPEPAAINAFLKDSSPDSYERLVDRLLANPHFGERWARHWLDVTRFAESHGFEHDYDRKFAFHFRDFVIRAFNQDLPYDQFVRWQLAGDELRPDDPLALMATGFLGAGVYPTQITVSEAERIRFDALDDMLATTGSAMLALSVGCARCHDHKFDPIPTRDYYRMLSIFTTTVRTEVSLDLGVLDDDSAAKYAKQLSDLRSALAKYETEQLPLAFQRWLACQDASSNSDSQSPLLIDVDRAVFESEVPQVKKDRDPARGAVADKIRALIRNNTDSKNDREIQEHFKVIDPGYQQIVADIAAQERIRHGFIHKVMICSEGPHVKPMRLHTSNDIIPDFYKESYFLNRGDPNQKDGVAEPGFLQVLTRTKENPTRWINGSNDKRTSGRRAALSQWITDTDCGAGHLLSRVIVNRLWQHYFGQGIVATPNNFGFQGDRPTNPELLDWLATELIRNGWRLKTIHKLILMSQTYRMGELASADNLKIDSENQFLWHRPPRRLEAEMIRDNALAVGGMMDLTLFGPGTLDEKSRRRSIYFIVKRGQLLPSMQVFDWPDALSSQGQRAVTTTPSQALVFINDPQFRQMAWGFAQRLRDEKDRIGQGFMIAYGRSPSDRERALSKDFIHRQSESHDGDAERTLTDFCAALMSANEFIYIE